MNTAAALAKPPVIEKIALIETLWASISESEIPVEPAHVEEARLRLDELKANPPRVCPAANCVRGSVDRLWLAAFRPPRRLTAEFQRSNVATCPL